MIVRPGRRRRPRPRPVHVRSSGFGDVAALVIGAEQGLPSGELMRRGMAGMGDVTEAIDTLTGGLVTHINSRLDDVELALKVSAGCALFAGLAALVALRRR